MKLQAFVKKFPSGLSRLEASKHVHKFISTTQDWMLSEVVVFAAEADEEGRTNACEGLEKFLLGKLHDKIFAMEPEDIQEDDRLYRKIDSLSWVSFDNLGVPHVDPELLELAIEQLRQMDMYKAPKDKLVCILNATRVINDVLKRAITESGSAGRPLAADDFLPLLIFVVIAANPPRLHSNVEFVAAFRHPSRLVAEDAYFLTALQSAVAFVNDAGAKALEVSEEDFKRLCAESLTARGHITSPTSASENEAALEPKGQQLAETVEMKAAELSEEQRQKLAQKLSALPLHFEGHASARQLRLRDVERLLEEYQELAKLLQELRKSDPAP